jgi:membrane protein
MESRRQQNERIWQQTYHFLLEIFRHVQWWSVVFIKAIRSALLPETALTAASIGYFTLFSLFPLMLLTVAIASLWFDPLWAESELVTQLEFVVPALGDLLGSNIEKIVMNRGPVSGFAALILLWSGSNIFNMLTRAMDRIWDVDQTRSLWRRRGLAMLIALSISFLFLIVYFAEGTIFTILNSLLPKWWDPLRPFTTQLWAAFISVALFALLYMLLPHITLTLKQVLPGAIVAGLVWEFAKRAFLTFIGGYLSRSNLVYGSVTTIIVFLTWTYVSAIIFLFGGYLNVEYDRRKKDELSSMPQ